MLKPLLAVLIATVTLAASGQEKKLSVKHLKKYDPDVLYFATHVYDDCPGTEESYEEIVEGELLRARIKPQESWDYHELFLQVLVVCNEDRKSSVRMITYTLYVDFAKRYRVIDPDPDEFDSYEVRLGLGYSGTGYRRGYGNAEVERGIQTVLREYVSAALTDYLRANFSE